MNFINYIYKLKLIIKNTKVIILTIILVSFVLRFANITSSPPALYGDELTMVYDAYSILHTGYDQTGQFLPLTFSMGAGRPAGYVYFSIPFVALFGPTAIGVRMLSVLSGVGITFLMYLLGRKLFSEKLGIIAAALLAISMWDISLSRGGFEAHFALFLMLLGTYLYLLFSQRPLLLIISAFSFGLAVHTYPTYKLILPVFLLLLLWYQPIYKYLSTLRSKIAIFISVAILLSAAYLTIQQALISSSETRFLSINIFAQEDLKKLIIEKINIERNSSSLPLLFRPVLHNQPLEYIFVLGEYYLKNFSLDFLFFHGDKNPRHNMSTMGELYIVEIFLVILGLRYFSQISRKLTVVLLLWLLISPIPASLLLDLHALRNAFMLPSLILFSAAGILYLLNAPKTKLFFYFKILILVGFIFQFIVFWERLFFIAPQLFSNFWSYSAKKAVEFAVSNRNNYKYIIISPKIDNVEYAFPVYTRIDPKQVINQNIHPDSLNGLYFKKIDNIYIGSITGENIGDFINDLGNSVLYLENWEERDKLDFYKVVYDINGLPAFVFTEKK
ncbi:hypothetical protein C4577_07660 [Candidatus Parcubacteria bacterium]|nr:MAG: hypothetical protein C4577_07660 [Candidatus Parcubacteria bacterium]